MSLGSQAYGEASYWENRYLQDSSGPFDWYQKYPALAPLFHLYLHKSNKILIVGCGNAGLGQGMVDDNYSDVVNIDISSVVIKAMQEKYRDRPHLKYMMMDVKNMEEFQSGSFDAVIDKGTLDSLMCGSNAQANVLKMLEEVWRVLKDQGLYILITYGSPMYRLSLLREPHLWDVKLHVIGKFATEKAQGHETLHILDVVPLNDDESLMASIERADVHYIYVCIKNGSRQQD